MTRRMNVDPVPLLTGDSDWSLDAETKPPGFWASCGWGAAAGGELPLTNPNAWTAFTGPDLAPTPPTPPLAVQLAAVARRPVVDGDCRVLCVVVAGGGP